MIKLAIIEHSGVQHITEVESYNALTTYKEIKAAQSGINNDFVILIGDVIIDARSIRTVTVIPEEAPTE